MVAAMKTLRCQMSDECTAAVTHIDEKGFIYCAEHGVQRRQSGRRCRRLRSWELRRLREGKAVPSYEPRPEPKGGPLMPELRQEKEAPQPTSKVLMMPTITATAKYRHDFTIDRVRHRDGGWGGPWVLRTLAPECSIDVIFPHHYSNDGYEPQVLVFRDGERFEIVAQDDIDAARSNLDDAEFEEWCQTRFTFEQAGAIGWPVRSVFDEALRVWDAVQRLVSPSMVLP